MIDILENAETLKVLAQKVRKRPDFEEDCFKDKDFITVVSRIYEAVCIGRTYTRISPPTLASRMEDYLKDKGYTIEYEHVDGSKDVVSILISWDEPKNDIYKDPEYYETTLEETGNWFDSILDKCISEATNISIDDEMHIINIYFNRKGDDDD